MTLTPLQRRVRRAEFARLLGFSVSWFRELERRGCIPKAHRDKHSRLAWWPENEVQATMAKFAAAQHDDPPPTGNPQLPRTRRHRCDHG